MYPWYEEYPGNQSLIFLPSNVTQFRYMVDARSAENASENYIVAIYMLSNNTIVENNIVNGIIQQGSQAESIVVLDFTKQSITIGQLPWWQQYWYAFVIAATVLIIGVIFLLRRRKTTHS
jgi:hypothetical protein